MSQAFVCSKRSRFIQSLIALAFCVLLGRLFFLHIWDQRFLAEQADSSRKMVRILESRRGNIVDQRGNLLASTQITVDIGVDPQSVVKEGFKKIERLAELLDIPAEKIETAFNTTTRKRANGQPYLVRWVPLAKGVDQEIADAVYKQISELSQSHKIFLFDGKMGSGKTTLIKKVVQEAEAATRRIREIKQMKVWDWPFETESSWGPSGKLVCNWMANEKAKNPKKFEAKKPVPAPLTVNIKHHLTGELYSFKVNNLIPISTLFKVYSNKTGLQQHTMKFKYNDEVFGYANKKFNGSKSLKKMKFKDNQTLEYTVNLPELYLGAVEDEVKYLGITSALTSSSSSSGEERW